MIVKIIDIEKKEHLLNQLADFVFSFQKMKVEMRITV